MDIQKLENTLFAKVSSIATSEDPAHDILHFQRVVRTAKYLCEKENAQLEVVLPAAWLHDFVIIAKDDPRRKQASRLSAEAAIRFLKQINYPEVHHSAIAHAIEAHSFSAAIEARSLEASVVQDADRLDGLGAIGIARCFATAGLLKRPFYSEDDPLCATRTPDDRRYTVDHFFSKLFEVAKSLKTEAGRAEGQKRVEVMRNYLHDLESEILF